MATNAEVRAALVKRLTAFGVRVSAEMARGRRGKAEAPVKGSDRRHRGSRKRGRACRAG